MAKNVPNRSYFKHEAIIRYARLLGFGEIHTKIDMETGLNAIIAIHSTQLGPAIGGTRFFHYSSTGAAIIDALRLAYTMTMKAAFNDLLHGGAKAVLLKPRIIKNRKAYFRAYGDFVHEMNGRYITAIDVGTKDEDMDIIAERTPYVFGARSIHKLESDPSPQTAKGVMHGIQAAVKFKLNRDNLDGIHVAIQGAGQVGYPLTKYLSELGAIVSISDTKPEAVQRCVDEFGATPADINTIYDIKCDVFSPCAMGGILNYENINRLKAPIIAGSANAQLAHRKYGQVLRDKNILYAPDFVINSGGLLFAATIYDYQDIQMANTKINNLYDRLLNLFERARSQNLPTTEVAMQIAMEKLRRKKVDKEESSHRMIL